MILDYSKQEDLIKVQNFNHRINVIGCGALGSWLTFFLLKMGFKDVHVYDYDTIEEHNLPNQNFEESQIGCLKVDAIASIYNRYFNDEEYKRLTIHNEKVDEEIASTMKGIIFCGVDSMKARKMIYTHSFKYGLADLWIEDRIGLWGAYVYMLDKADPDFIAKAKKYEGTLYDDVEAEVSSCGISQTGLPAAVNAASVMIMEMIRWYRNEVDKWRIEYQIPEMYAVTE